jgi:cysteine/O-acetylserine efflux protein
MENLTGGTPPVRYLLCVVPCKLYFVNVKIYLFGITALTGYITDYSTSFSALLVAELTIATIGTIATLIWIGLGTLLRTVYQKYYRPIDIVLALTLLECIYSMLK